MILRMKIIYTAGPGTYFGNFFKPEPVTFGICSVSMDTVPDISRENSLSLYRVVWPLCLSYSVVARHLLDNETTLLGMFYYGFI